MPQTHSMRESQRELLKVIVLALTVSCLCFCENKNTKKEKHVVLPAVSADAVLAPVSSASDDVGRRAGNETWVGLVAVVVGEHFISAPVRLQGFGGERVLRQIRFPSDERTISPLISLHLHTSNTHQCSNSTMLNIWTFCVRGQHGFRWFTVDGAHTSKPHQEEKSHGISSTRGILIKESKSGSSPCCPYGKTARRRPEGLINVWLLFGCSRFLWEFRTEAKQTGSGRPFLYGRFLPQRDAQTDSLNYLNGFLFYCLFKHLNI